MAWEWLPWLTASIRCSAPEHQGPIEFFQFTGAEPANEFEPHAGREPPSVTTKPKKSSKLLCRRDLPRHPQNKEKHVVGQIQCFYVGGVLWAAWHFDNETGSRRGTVGAMPADNFTNPEKFFKFLETNNII